MAKILLADDEESIRILIKHLVVGKGYEFVGVSDGSQVLETVLREKPDLLILDVMMPGMNGFEACVEMRRQGITVPVIFLTAKGDIVDKGIGFSVGGDDYLVKPFEPQELLYRIEALLRRAPQSAMSVPAVDELEYKDFSIDKRKRQVLLKGQEVYLAPKEYELLNVLTSSPGTVFTRDQLIEQVWGKDYVGNSTSIAVIVRRIREKIEEDPSHPEYLQSVFRVGYRFGE